MMLEPTYTCDGSSVVDALKPDLFAHPTFDSTAGGGKAIPDRKAQKFRGGRLFARRASGCMAFSTILNILSGSLSHEGPVGSMLCGQHLFYISRSFFSESSQSLSCSLSTGRPAC